MTLLAFPARQRPTRSPLFSPERTSRRYIPPRPRCHLAFRGHVATQRGSSVASCRQPTAESAGDRFETADIDAADQPTALLYGVPRARHREHLWLSATAAHLSWSVAVIPDEE